jgi:glycine betaine/proline transport system ATP-binding protein
MDEAYSALDPLIRVDMQTVLLDLQAELKKTVVFITHDLDEALRLGDRIAILRDGEVIQQGSGQDIVLSPADDYISAFVKEVNRGRVIQARTIMRPLGAIPQAADGPRISALTMLETAAKQLCETGQSAGTVIDRNGTPVGTLALQDVISAMVTPAGHDGARIAAE